MGMLVKDWVIDQLGLPVPQYSDAAEFGKELSNGFIIAEILRKYSIISDDQLVTLPHNNYSQGTKVKNMTLLHRWMTGAGIHGCDLVDLMDVAHEKPGGVVRLLYKLYFLLEGGGHGEGHHQGHNKGHPTTQGFDLSEDIRPSVVTKHEFITRNLDYGIETGDILGMPELAEEEEDDVIFDPEVDPDYPGVYYESLPEADRDLSSDDDIGPPIPRCVSLTQIPTTNPDPTNLDLDLDDVTVDLDDLVRERLHECPLITPAMVNAAYNVSDSREATKIYFAGQAIHKIREFPLPQRNPEQELLDLVAHCQTIDFSSIVSEVERARLRQMKAKLEQEYRLVQEMGSFDRMLDEVEEAEERLEEESKTRKRSMEGQGLISGQERPETIRVKIHPRDATPIQPSPIAMKMRLTRLKCLRKEESLAAEERSRYRRSLAASLIKNIPLQIQEDLLETALCCTNSISGKETELCQYFVDSYKPKAMFLDHIRSEGSALSSLRIERSERLAQDKGRTDDLETLTRDLFAQREGRIEDQKADIEMALLLRFIAKQLNLMIRLATRIADYRELTGEEPSPEQIEEWKAWLLLGLDTPDLESSNSDFGFGFKDGNCRIILSEDPIPAELNPNVVKWKYSEDKNNKGPEEEEEDEEEEEEEEYPEEEESEMQITPQKKLKGKKGDKKSKKLAKAEKDKDEPLPPKSEASIQGPKKKQKKQQAPPEEIQKPSESLLEVEADGQKSQKKKQKKTKSQKSVKL